MGCWVGLAAPINVGSPVNGDNFNHHLVIIDGVDDPPLASASRIVPLP